MDTFRPTPADADLFARIADEIAAHPDEYQEAGRWMDERYGREGVLAARASGGWRASDYLPPPMDPANEAIWRLNCCAVDLRSQFRGGDLDLSVMGEQDRLKVARRIVYMTWLVTDPDAAERGVGASSLERAPWPGWDGRALGRSGARDTAYVEPDDWRGLLEPAWRAVQRYRSVPAAAALTLATVEAAPAAVMPAAEIRVGTREDYLAYLESEPRTCAKAILGFFDAARRVAPAHVEGAIAEHKARAATGAALTAAGSRGRVQSLVKRQMPALLHEALLLAGDDRLRKTLDLRLQRILDLAEELAEALDGVTADRLLNLEQRALRGGPWVELYTRLQTAVQHAWTLIAISDQSGSDPAPMDGPAAPPALDVEALLERMVTALGDRLNAGQPRQIRPISVSMAESRYNVSAQTLRNAVKAGRLADHRPPGAAENSPLVLDEDAVAGIWPKRAAEIAPR